MIFLINWSEKMSIQSINIVTENGEVSAKNLNEKQLISILNVLNVEPKKPLNKPNLAKKPAKRKVRNKYKGKRICNNQFEMRAKPITDDFDIDKALSLSIIKTSIDTGNQLTEKSKQVEQRRNIITCLVFNENKPMTQFEILNLYAENYEINSHSAISNYISQLSRLGVLAKNTKNNKFHLSRYFLDMVYEKGN